MGGIGSGGQPGMGQKPRGEAARKLHGGRNRARVNESPAKPSDVPMPMGLSPEVQAYWQQYAPLALSELTLTPATAGALADLCKAMARTDALEKRLDVDGWTYVKVTIDGSGQEHSELKKHPLYSEYRAWFQRVEAGRAKFRLTAMGREIIPKQPEADPFDEFQSQPLTVVAGGKK